MSQTKKAIRHLSPIMFPLETVDRDFLTTAEAAVYLNISINQLYKLNMAGSIPYYRPTGGKIYYLRSELHDWVLKARRASVLDINKKATKFINF